MAAAQELAQELSCNQCGESYTSRNKLFKHLKVCGSGGPALDAWPAADPTVQAPAASDRDALLGSLRRCGSALQLGSAEQQDDESICAVAVSQNGKALEHASPRLQAARSLVLQAVRQNGRALQFAHESLRSDREVAMAAVKQNRKALEFCGEHLRNDPTFTVAAVCRTGAGPHHPRRSTGTATGQNRRKEARDKKKKTNSHELWTRCRGWHEAGAREEEVEGKVSAVELVVALEKNVAASCARLPPRRRRRWFCRSCGGGVPCSTPAAGHTSSPTAVACWACSGRTVVDLVLTASSGGGGGGGGLSARDRASMARTCKTWRAQCFLSQIPSNLLEDQTGREWLQRWYSSFERSLEGVPAAVAAGGDTLSPIDMDAGESLHMALKRVCTHGVMPDFSDGGALAHYAVENIVQRAQKTTAALLLDELRPLLSSLLLSPTRPTIRVVAVGGGPGFEAVGLAALAEYLRTTVDLECWSMDIEAGWEPVLGAVVAGTCDAAGKPCCAVVSAESLLEGAEPGPEPEPETEPEPEPEPEPELETEPGAVAAVTTHPQLRHRIAFVASDCLTGHAGPDLLRAAPSMDLFTFNYCMVENAKALRADRFGYLRKVFGAAQVGAVFIFMDAAYHLWREVVGVFASLRSGGAQRFAVLHPHPQPWQCNSAMVAVKLC